MCMEILTYLVIFHPICRITFVDGKNYVMKCNTFKHENWPGLSTVKIVAHAKHLESKHTVFKTVIK